MADKKRIYLCLAHMSDAGLEQKYIKEAFDTNWVVPLGPNVNGFVSGFRFSLSLLIAHRSQFIAFCGGVGR